MATNKWRALFMGLLYGILIPLSPARAQTAEVFRVGVEDLNYFPYYGDDHGVYIGFARDVLDAFAASKGYSFNYVGLPINRLFATFVDPKGDLDFKFPDDVAWQADLKRPVKVIYSAPVIHYVDGVMVPAVRKGEGLVDGFRLGTVMGFSPIGYFDQIRAGTVKLQESPSILGLLSLAIQGRVDGAYVNISVARYQLHNIIHQGEALVYDPDLPHVDSSYRLSTIKHPEVIEEFNRFLVDHTAEIQALRRRYDLEGNS